MSIRFEDQKNDMLVAVTRGCVGNETFVRSVGSTVLGNVGAGRLFWVLGCRPERRVGFFGLSSRESSQA